MTSKRERNQEEWRETLQRIADKLPDVDIPPPVDVDEDDDTHRGSPIPPPLPEN